MEIGPVVRGRFGAFPDFCRAERRRDLLPLLCRKKIHNMQKPDYKEFERAVYDVVAAVPPGRATSYGAIARALGYPNHSRLVGRIMGRCSRTDVPAHRVVDSRGCLSGRHAFGEPCRMCGMLEAEGVHVAGDRIVQWNRVFWDPQSEMEP